MPIKPSTQFQVRTKFAGRLRYHHRTTAARKQSWEEWVDQTCREVKKPSNWAKIVSITFVVLVLSAIIGGLLVELGWSWNR